MINSLALTAWLSGSFPDGKAYFHLTDIYSSDLFLLFFLTDPSWINESGISTDLRTCVLTTVNDF